MSNPSRHDFIAHYMLGEKQNDAFSMKVSEANAAIVAK